MITTEIDKKCSILGFRNVKICDVERFLKKIRANIHPTKIQIVDATKVAGKSHLFFAFLNAQVSFEQGLNISENLEIEVLLYATGTRQIVKAIEILGINSKSINIGVMLFDSDKKKLEKAAKTLTPLIEGIRDDTVLDLHEQGKTDLLLEFFGITSLEWKTMTGCGFKKKNVLTWLIVEKGALLSIKR